MAKASNSTPTPIAMALPVKAAVATCFRRSAAIFALRKALGGAEVFGGVWSSAVLGMAIVSSFQIGHFSQHPLPCDDPQQQQEVKGGGPKFHFQGRTDPLGFEADGFGQFIKVL